MWWLLWTEIYTTFLIRKNFDFLKFLNSVNNVANFTDLF